MRIICPSADCPKRPYPTEVPEKSTHCPYCGNQYTAQALQKARAERGRVAKLHADYYSKTLRGFNILTGIFVALVVTLIEHFNKLSGLSAPTILVILFALVAGVAWRFLARRLAEKKFPLPPNF